jgi:thiamine kinase-like enzyme
VTEGLDRLLGSLGVLNGQVARVDELGGGATNRSYRVRTTAGDDAVVRVAQAPEPPLPIDREREHDNAVIAAAAGVGPTVLAARPEQGVLVVGYLAGTPVQGSDLAAPAVAGRLIRALRGLHGAAPFQGTFDLADTRAKYLSMVGARGLRLPAGYDSLSDRVEALEGALSSVKEPLVPCHNDLVPDNLIDDGRRVWIIDYEYSAMNEASYDLGSLGSACGATDETLTGLVEGYWDRMTPAKLARARAWSVLVGHAWLPWAALCAETSSADFDFWAWGLQRYETAREQLLSPTYQQMIRVLGEPG